VADIGTDSANETAEAIRAAGGEAMDLAVDVSDDTAVRGMIDHTVSTWGRLDIVHNNAASTQMMSDDVPVHLQDVAVWDRTFAIIARGTFLGCKYAIPHLIASGGGSIVNTSSLAAQAGAWTNPAYGSAKGAVETLTKCVATRYGKDGVRCNAIAPGYVLTPEAERMTPPEIQERFTQAWLDIGLSRRVGRPEDIARAVLFLSTDDADYVTGQILSIDGGQLAWGVWSKLQSDEGYRGLAMEPIVNGETK
jgi:NAD(P)-dependent dehydrogenase (short-subunit alcohol dehydrogenase family)